MPTKAITAHSYVKILFILVLFLCFWGQFERDEWTPDEPRVTAIAIEMAETGEVIIPHLAGQAFIEKPPLYFMLGAGLIKVLPIVEPITALRILNVLLALFTLYFTYQLGKSLVSHTTGYWAVMILGTMEGFVVQTHWSRVDNLLLLTVIAASWAFYHGIKYQRSSHILLGAIFAGLAFLTKGFVGIAIIMTIWLAVMLTFMLHYNHYIARYNDNHAKKAKTTLTKKHLITQLALSHGAGFILLSLIAGTWIILFKQTGTPETWHQWFWVNHFGRFAGDTAQLGHIKTGQPFYYLAALSEYSLPWLPVLLMWLLSIITKMLRRHTLDPINTFLLLACVIPLLLLSASATKRSLYLLPLLPLFALTTAYYLPFCIGKWTRYFQQSWFTLCALIITLIAGIPFYLPFIPARLADKIPDNIHTYLSYLHWRFSIVVLCLLTMVYLWRIRHKVPFFHHISAVTLCLYVSLFSLLVPVVNMAKSMRQSTHAFIEQIPLMQREKIAAYRLSETSLAALVITAHWKIPQIHDPLRVHSILQGQDPHYQSVIVEHTGTFETLLPQITPKLSLTDLHLRPLAIGKIRSNKKNGLYWISDKPTQKKTAQGTNTLN
ncbi:ArnT family glycosyltransferase [Shewanella surugensis]|uniref:Glycosyltransferase family 39 protein n=1 Tax=Shewanella surugensis TaxID=212020 RepID=A0ABT0LGV4_9GAMM|nr:glycosyltransferase family 39 protein [Shewanella surugensis]MCL1126923.1 glycosyltransferase family 39 protein [Shewanella surugensis]